MMLNPIEQQNWEQFQIGVLKVMDQAKLLMDQNPEMQIQLNFLQGRWDIRNALELQQISGDKLGRKFLEAMAKAEPKATVLMLYVALDQIKKAGER